MIQTVLFRFHNICQRADLQRQIILFQKNTSTFRRITTAANKFKKWTEIEIKNFDFSFKIEEITYENTFWDYVDKSTEIYNLNLHLNSPNLFEGKLKAEDLLKKLKGFFNNTETDINLENEEGKLTLKKDILKSFIKYIAGGGGKWRLDSNYSGKRQKLKSQKNENIKIIEFPKNIEENLNTEYKIIIKNKIMEIDDIMNDKNDL